MVWRATIRNSKGAQAEKTALLFLKQQGLLLLERNFAFKGGEIDLIMKEGNCIVFCEVRYRKSLAFGGAAESITSSKKIKIKHTATYYLQRKNILDVHPCRFDVLAVEPIDCASENKTSVRWIRNAFDI